MQLTELDQEQLDTIIGECEENRKELIKAIRIIRELSLMNICADDYNKLAKASFMAGEVRRFLARHDKHIPDIKDTRESQMESFIKLIYELAHNKELSYFRASSMKPEIEKMGIKLDY